MVTLGEIISINAETNLCLVKLPTLEGAGNKNKIELHATMMLPPGIDAGYEVGDVVFVSFVDNTLGRPMVLGQLYRGPGKGTKIDKIGNLNDNSLGCAKTMTCNELVARDKATLPQTTTFTSAPADYNTPAELISKIKDLEGEVNRLQAALIALATAAAGGFLADFKVAAAGACCAIGATLGLGELVAEAIKEATKEETSTEEGQT